MKLYKTILPETAENEYRIIPMMHLTLITMVAWN